MRRAGRCVEGVGITEGAVSGALMHQALRVRPRSTDPRPSLTFTTDRPSAFTWKSFSSLTNRTTHWSSASHPRARPISNGAQLIVQENQEAMFFRDGKAIDASAPAGTR